MALRLGVGESIGAAVLVGVGALVVNRVGRGAKRAGYLVGDGARGQFIRTG